LPAAPRTLLAALSSLVAFAALALPAASAFAVPAAALAVAVFPLLSALLYALAKSFSHLLAALTAFAALLAGLRPIVVAAALLRAEWEGEQEGDRGRHVEDLSHGMHERCQDKIVHRAGAGHTQLRQARRGHQTATIGIGPQRHRDGEPDHDTTIRRRHDGRRMSSADAATNDRPLRVLRVLTRPNLGGPTRQAIALWHAHAERDVETLLVTGVVGADEVELLPADAGVPIVDPNAPPRTGWLTLPDLRRGVDPFADRRATRALRRLVQTWRPHVVHTHTSKAGMVGRRAAFAERAPVVAHTFHGHVLRDYFGRLPTLLLRQLERRLARRTDLLLAISASCADELADCGVAPRERFVVVPPAVQVGEHATRSEAREHLGIPANERRVCAIGRLVPIKRLADFVAMVEGAGDLHGDLIGDGPERAALQALAGTRVTLRGAMPDIARWLRAYDAVVLPSVREGCPLVAIEAFAAGVPVVGYDVPGVRDALADVGRGVLVPEADGPAGLRRAVAALADANARSALVDAARRAVATTAPAAVAERLERLYRQAAAKVGDSRYDPEPPG